MDAELQQQQEKLLAKLYWLNGRTKTDYKGNPSPYEKSKTQKSVAAARRETVRRFAGDGDFRPFSHGEKGLMASATPTKHLHGVQFAGHRPNDDHAMYNTNRQRLDPHTRRTEIATALCWVDCVPLRDDSSGRDAYTQVPAATSAFDADDAHAFRHRMSAREIVALPKEQRVAVLREEVMSKPKSTYASRSQIQRQRWLASSQNSVNPK